jgi:hypothetical protein
MKEPFTILTNHANLTYWKVPRNLNRWMAQWHVDLQEYNFKIVQILSNTNTSVEALSQPNGADQAENDNQNITLLIGKGACALPCMRFSSSGSVDQSPHQNEIWQAGHSARVSVVDKVRHDMAG